MKTPSLLRLALCASVLALASTGLALAQDTSGSTTTTPSDSGAPPPPPPGGGGPGGGPGDGPGGWHHPGFEKVLTPEERAELKKDTDQVMASNPDLKKEGEDLRSQRPGPDATDADKQAFREKIRDYMGKVREAVEAIDPNAAALYAKIDAARKAHEANKDANAGGNTVGGGGNQ